MPSGSGLRELRQPLSPRSSKSPSKHVDKMDEPRVSVVVVSFNTRDLLRRCLTSVRRQCRTFPLEVIVVDNDSQDDSAEMVAREFSEVHLIRSGCNLGFAAANNRAFSIARGRYVVMLNSDACMYPDALARSVAHMDANPRAALASGRLVDVENVWQPSARMFPSPLNKFLTVSGLAERYRSSRFFGRCERTWADPFEAAQVDWVGGAYMIVRRAALEEVGYFDERFFLYCEEIDLCRRIRAAGFEVWFWPDVVVSHVGGASTKTVLKDDYRPGAQVVSWRMRSELLYFRKYHSGLSPWCVMAIEVWWHRARMLRNSVSSDRARAAKAADSRRIATAMRDAWHATQGGRISPPRPWTARHV